jgi:hypothetical protein
MTRTKEPSRSLQIELRVGVAGAPVAALLQPADEDLEVLDRAVVDDGYRTGAVDVRVGVAVGRRAVRRPTGVTDREGPGERQLRQHLLQVSQLAGLALD